MYFIDLELLRIGHISANKCLIVMGFQSKCSILSGEVKDIKNQNCILHVTHSP